MHHFLTHSVGWQGRGMCRGVIMKDQYSHSSANRIVPMRHRIDDGRPQGFFGQRWPRLRLEPMRDKSLAVMG